VWRFWYLDSAKKNCPDTKQTRVVKKTVPTESFFNFFSPPKAPTDEDDDDAATDIEERLELDYQLGEDIKEKLIPRAIDWFTGEALQFEELDDDMEEGDFEDEDDEEDDDLSEDHDDDEESDEDVRSQHFYLGLHWANTSTGWCRKTKAGGGRVQAKLNAHPFCLEIRGVLSLSLLVWLNILAFISGNALA
jgi:hypothetical protein